VDPMFATSSLRIDVAGVPAIDGLTFASTGERLLVLGAPSALFEVAAGMRAPTRGDALLEGRLPVNAVREGLAAGAPVDPPLPPRWTVVQYVTWSARLVGHARSDASDLAADALARMSLAPAAAGKLGKMPLPVRRATVIAAALATDAKLIVLEDPMTGLPPPSVGQFARVLVRALGDRRVMLFAGRMRLESPLALDADEAVVVCGSQVAAQGAPAEIAAAERAFAVRLAGDARAFADVLQKEGARVLRGLDGGSPTRGSVDLGPLATHDVLRIAAASSAIVLELRPIALAFA
jgi:ABC-type multidrug transport system ATPase subunit